MPINEKKISLIALAMERHGGAAAIRPIGGKDRFESGITEFNNAVQLWYEEHTEYGWTSRIVETKKYSQFN